MWGSEIDALMVEAQYTHPHLRPRPRFVLRSHLGWIETSDFNDVPPDLRYFAGGDRSIRGYDYESISPKDENGELLGASRLLTGSIEYQLRVTGNWWGAVFLDIGRADNKFEFSNFKKGAGVGIRWESPLGPVKLDIARPVGDSQESGIQFYIGWDPSYECAKTSHRNLCAGRACSRPRILLGTETGLQIIKGALEKAVPGLRIESLSGSVFSLKADNLQYTPRPGISRKSFMGLSVAKLLSRRVALHDFEFQTPRSFERRKWRRRLQRRPETLLKSRQTQTSRFKTPVAVIVERVAIKNLQADIDGNLLTLDFFRHRLFGQNRLDIDSVLWGFKFASAQTPPSDEPSVPSSAPSRSCAEIPTVDLPLDLISNV